jgi:integrase
MGPQTIRLIVARYGRLAGIKAKPHEFRDAKASLPLNRGANVSEVRDILGHTSPETTKKVHAHYTVSRLSEAFDRHSRTVGELAAEGASAD